MSEDKRKVHTDALETLGMIIDETEKRDAIHLAVEPVVAKECLVCGQHVDADGSTNGEYVGIVDPFLNDTVEPGERFWLVLYPRQITSLRHVWEHPAFPNEINNKSVDDTEVEKSKKWIENFIADCGEDKIDIDYGYTKYDDLTYKNIMEAADSWVAHRGDYPDYFYVSESLRDKGLPYEFWHHYEIIRGKKIDEDKKTSFFTCSC